MIRFLCSFVVMIGLIGCSATPTELPIEQIQPEPMSDSASQSSASSALEIESVVVVVPSIRTEENIAYIDISFTEESSIQGVDLTIDDFKDGVVEKLVLAEDLRMVGWMMVPNLQDTMLKASAITTTPLTTDSNVYEIHFSELPTDTINISLGIIIGTEIKNYALNLTL